MTAAVPDTFSGYVRLSREAGESNLSRDGMVADVAALVAREGGRLVAMHVDDGLSGAIRDRPEFVAWLDDARHGRAANLAAWHVDRMTREGVNVAALILDVVEGKDPTTGRVTRSPVRLLDTKGLDSSGDESAFRFRFVIAAEVARAERERMRDRSRAAQRRLREAGRFRGGTAPFGTRAADAPGGGRVLEPDPVEAEALREAARLVIDGRTTGEVARRMNARGPAPRRGGSWSRTTVAQVLTSEGASRLVFGAAERAAIRRALDATPRDRPQQSHGPARLLARALRCHACGSLLNIHYAPTGRVGYVCRSHGDGRVCPAPVYVSAPLIDEAVERLWLDGWGVLPETVATRESDELADRIAVLDEEIESAWDGVSARRGHDRAEALAAIEAKEAERDVLAATEASTLVVIRETGRTYAEAWRAGDLDDRRALVRRTVGALTVLPGRRGPRRFNPARLADAWKLDPAAADARHEAAG